MFASYEINLKCSFDKTLKSLFNLLIKLEKKSNKTLNTNKKKIEGNLRLGLLLRTNTVHFREIQSCFVLNKDRLF